MTPGTRVQIPRLDQRGKPTKHPGTVQAHPSGLIGRSLVLLDGDVEPPNPRWVPNAVIEVIEEV